MKESPMSVVLCNNPDKDYEHKPRRDAKKVGTYKNIKLGSNKVEAG